MDSSNGSNNNTLIFSIVAFLLGLVIGLVVLGWGLFPVEYTGAGPQDLLPNLQDNYLRSVADLYAFDGNQGRVQEALSIWPQSPLTLCRMADESADPAERSRLTAIAQVVNNGAGCDPAALAAISDAEDAGNSNNLLLICALGLLLLGLLAAIYALWQRQTIDEMPKARRTISADEMGEAPPALEGGEIDPGVSTTPVARFRTSYKRGHDTYDDSFSIENANGEFLGECGVGISESIGIDAPKNVTAFEVWLFDKNDIRTVTKVVMSDHAFFDEALKAKLAPKGEPMMGREGETVVLETASLIINAEVTELTYGESAELPAQSYFEGFVVELSAWAKDGDFEMPDIEGRVDELMNY